MTSRGKRGAMSGLDPEVSTAENYRRFAREAAGRSPAYETLSRAVASDDAVLSFLASLEPAQRQPNLLFASARLLLGSPPDEGSLRRLVTENPEALAEVMRTRRTQTNEAARCATLLPALSLLPPPLALLEVGAAAGLTLVPDLYHYDYSGHVVRGTDGDSPVLHCRMTGPVSLPDRTPEVVWRAGIDLNPLDVSNPADLEWLACLVWPDEHGRAERLRHAARVVARARPVIWKGDLLDRLAEVAGTAPSAATLVVYHTAVLAYVDRERREIFAEEVKRLGAVWLSNEAPGVVAASSPETEGFVLARDGEEILAHTDPHGMWMDWLAGPGGESHVTSHLPRSPGD